MRKIVAELFVSLDGVVEMPEESILAYFNDEVVEIIEAGGIRCQWPWRPTALAPPADPTATG